MTNDIYLWITTNWAELLGTILGLIYIFLSVKQNIWTWPVGLACSVLYIYVYFHAKFYADMALQFYYVGVSIYGWYFWLKGNKQNKKKELAVSRCTDKQWLLLLLSAMALCLFIFFILNDYTDSPVPLGDAITTALSLVATWMLARKLVEHWTLWIFIDAYSTYLYVQKDLMPTALLFIVYTIMAIVGFVQWKKEITQATSNGE
ncbi:MAG: nicotinamide riboside transporter PnuC [Mangrovibacterium sp.]